MYDIYYTYRLEQILKTKLIDTVTEFINIHQYYLHKQEKRKILVRLRV